MSFQEYLKQQMREKGLTAKEIERRSAGKISDSYISKLLKGRTKVPSVTKLKQFAAVLEIDEREIFAAAGGEPVEREEISAQTLVFLMQEIVRNTDLAAVVQLLAKQKRAKIKTILKGLDSRN